MSLLSDAVNDLADAAAAAQQAACGNSNDAEHDALIELIDAANNVIACWPTS